MKKLLLSILLVFSIFILNAQRMRDFDDNYTNNFNKNIQAHYPYSNDYYINPNQNRVKTNILPSLIGAILGAVIVNSTINNQYDYGNARQRLRENYYQNQLELQRIELLKMQLETLERQHYRKEKGFLGFPKRHHRY
jgi:hypothetical protein